MEFIPSSIQDLVTLFLDENEAAEWDEGDDAQADLKYKIQEEIRSRNIEVTVSVCLEDGTEIWEIEPLDDAE